MASASAAKLVKKLHDVWLLKEVGKKAVMRWIAVDCDVGKIDTADKRKTMCQAILCYLDVKVELKLGSKSEKEASLKLMVAEVRKVEAALPALPAEPPRPPAREAILPPLAGGAMDADEEEVEEVSEEALPTDVVDAMVEEKDETAEEVAEEVAEEQSEGEVENNMVINE